MTEVVVAMIICCDSYCILIQSERIPQPTLGIQRMRKEEIKRFWVQMIFWMSVSSILTGGTEKKNQRDGQRAGIRKRQNWREIK